MPCPGPRRVEIERLKQPFKTLRQTEALLFRLGLEVTPHVPQNVGIFSLKKGHHSPFERRSGTAEMRHNKAQLRKTGKHAVHDTHDGLSCLQRSEHTAIQIIKRVGTGGFRLGMDDNGSRFFWITS